MLRTLITLQTILADRTDRMKNDTGATAVEYGIMVTFIALAIIVAVTALGVKLSGMFAAVTTAI